MHSFLVLFYLQPLEKSAKEFISSFVKRSICHNVKNKDVGDRLQHKALMLDTLNVAKPKKKRKTRGLSAREKRLKGIYKIPVEDQK